VLMTSCLYNAGKIKDLLIGLFEEMIVDSTSSWEIQRPQLGEAEEILDPYIVEQIVSDMSQT
jgi:hypothetical protein